MLDSNIPPVSAIDAPAQAIWFRKLWSKDGWANRDVDSADFESAKPVRGFVRPRPLQSR